MRWLAFFLCLTMATPVWAGASRNCDGNNDEMTPGNTFNVTTGDVSVCMWGDIGTSTAPQHWIGKKNDKSTAAGYALGNDSAETAGMWVADGTDQNTQGFGTSIVTGWHHLCGTWEGATQTNALYVDGVLDDSGTSTDVGSLTNAINFTICSEDDAGADLDGNVAYAWGRNGLVITLAEVNELRWTPERGMFPQGSASSNTSLWPLWGSNSPEIDVAGAARSLTLSGTSANANGPPVMFGDAPL